MSGAAWSRARLARLHDVMAGHVERGEMPGIVTLLSRRGEVHVDAIGATTLGGREPMQRDTIFRITSMTKPITAVAAMILVEECRLRLDELVDRLLPELAHRRVLRSLDGPLDDTVPASRPITLRDLLTFRMGLGIVMAPAGAHPIRRAIDELGIVGFGPPDPSTPHEPDEWLRRLATLPLMHQPGERWMYNTGSYVLGVLIARASGQSLPTFLRERVFEPLGMKDTGFSVPAAKLDGLASSYWPSAATGELELHDGVADSRWSRPPAFPDAGAGLVSTVDDYLAFGLMMLNRGQARRHAAAVPALGRDDDDRSTDAGAESGVRVLSRVPRRPRLGVRRVDRRPPGRPVRGARAIRLGRRLRHLLVVGPGRAAGRHPDDPARGLPGSRGSLRRLLDLGLPGDRRLTRPVGLLVEPA
jgi:CubicO group peptidase (beta-lactamase class C family)